ncbi:MAG: hypothetical protein P4L84_03655 [Isosphaeraceae bacterium]|nr:hypothetical protein [Isosphaeraceae bacterium]
MSPRSARSPETGAGPVADEGGRLAELKIQRWLIPVAAAAVVGLIMIAFFRSLPSPHLTMELYNDTGSPMANVRFLFCDGKALRTCDKVSAGGMIAWDVAGQSRGFSLDYLGPNGQVVTRKCDFYFDGDEWGTVSVRIKRDGLKILTEVDPTAKGTQP